MRFKNWRSIMSKVKLPKITDHELVEYLVECYRCNCVFDYDETMTECPECASKSLEAAAILRKQLQYCL